jgi:hypothetical protein
MEDKIRIYYWNGVAWDVEFDINGEAYPPIPLCPKKNCHCSIVKSSEKYNLGEYKYKCLECDFKITFDKDIQTQGKHFLRVFETLKYKDAEMINLDGELIRLNVERLKKDPDYWIEGKLSKNKKGEKHLMVLVGSRKDNDKAQLFLDIDNERLSFDQNNSHPKEILAKVTATFKHSKASIKTKKRS